MISKLIMTAVVVLGLVLPAPHDQAPTAPATMPMPQVGYVSVNGVVIECWIDGVGFFSVGPACLTTIPQWPDPGSVSIKFFDKDGDEIVVVMPCSGFQSYQACADAAKKLVDAMKQRFPPPAPPEPPKKENTEKKEQPAPNGGGDGGVINLPLSGRYR